MERAISSVNVDDTTNVWNHVRTRNLSIKSTWMPRPRIIIRAIEKYRGGRGGGVGGSCRQYRRCKYLTKIRRRLSFSPALLVPRRIDGGEEPEIGEMSAKLSSAALVRRLYRKFQTNERRFSFFHLFFLPFPLPLRPFSPLVLLPFCFLFPVGRDLGLDPRRVSKNRSPLRVSIPRPNRYISTRQY